MSAASALAVIQQASLSQQVIKASGAGKAYQSVMNSCAIGIGDATDYLRNIATICTAAIGVAMAQLAELNLQYLILLIIAIVTLIVAAIQYKLITKAIIGVATTFPSG